MALNWDMIAALAESVGAVGVVLSLVYLAREVRANASATRRANVYHLNGAGNEFLTQIATNPDLAALWRRGMADPDSLTPAEAVQLSALLLQLTAVWQESFYAQKRRDVPPWAGYQGNASRREILTLPGFARWYEQRREWLSPAFRTHLDEEIRSGSAAPSPLYGLGSHEGEDGGR